MNTYYEVIDGLPSLWDNPGHGRTELELQYDSQGSFVMLICDQPLPANDNTPHFKMVGGKPTFFDIAVEGSVPMTLIDKGWVWEHPDHLHLLKPQAA